MPQAFKNCVKNGGKVRTQSLGGGKYRPICSLNGQSYPGYIKTKGAEKENKYSKGLASHGRKSSY